MQITKVIMIYLKQYLTNCWAKQTNVGDTEDACTRMVRYETWMIRISLVLWFCVSKDLRSKQQSSKRVKIEQQRKLWNQKQKFILFLSCSSLRAFVKYHIWYISEFPIGKRTTFAGSVSSLFPLLVNKFYEKISEWTSLFSFLINIPTVIFVLLIDPNGFKSPKVFFPW